MCAGGGGTRRRLQEVAGGHSAAVCIEGRQSRHVSLHFWGGVCVAMQHLVVTHYLFLALSLGVLQGVAVC